MNHSDYIRYSRQILLEDIAIKGQKKLLSSQVLIIGLGGLGSPAAIYLAGAGIGKLVLADYDKVHLSNLHRQILFTTKDISMPKAYTAQRRLRAFNPEIQVIALQKKLTEESLQYQIAAANVVLDCTDSIETKQIINSVCVATDTPLITASAIGFIGQLMVLTPPWLYGCYRCLWPDDNEPDLNCHTVGIIGPVVGIMGTLQALEALKLLSGMKTNHNKISLFDAYSGDWHQLILKRSTNCIICGERYADLN